MVQATSILANPRFVGNGPATTCANIMFSARGGPAYGGHRVFVHNKYYSNNMDKGQQLKALHEKWLKKCSCKLRKTAIQGVPGAGNPNAEIVFIGEAPGKKEDELGMPFVGAAGRFLAEMLGEIKMKRDGVYITNIVKYRPPDNRDPSPEEKSSCRAWLIEELNLIQPKLIIFLGRHAMNDFFPTEKISEVHGKLLIKKPARLNDISRSGGFKGISTKHFFPLYHPAAALYNGGLRETLMDDFKKIPLILKKINNEK